MTAGYEMGNWGAEAFVGRTRFSPSLPGMLKLKSTDIGVRAYYDVSDQFQVAGHLTRSRIKGSYDNIPVIKAHSIGIEGDYSVSNSPNLFGGLSQQKGKVDGVSVKLNTGSLGLGYTIDGTAGGNMGPVTVSLEAVRSRGSISMVTEKATATSWRLGVSIPLGGAKRTAPLNSHAKSINNGNRNIAHSVVGTLF